MPRLARSAAAGPRRLSARRSPAPGSRSRDPRARRAAHRGAFRWRSPVAPSSTARSRRGRSPDHRHEPALGGPLGAAPALVGSLVEVVATNLRHGRRRRGDLRDREGLRADAGRRRRRSASGGGSGSPAPAPATRRRGTGRPDPTTSTTPRARSSCSRDGSASGRLRTGRSATSRSSIRAARVEATADGASSSAGVVGELHPAVVEAWDLRGARVVVAELGSPASAAASDRRDRRGPARHQSSERDLRSSSRRTWPPATSQRRSGRTPDRT